jgi:HlyD family secretion protein
MWLASHTSHPAIISAAPQIAQHPVAAAQGRVEGNSESVPVGAAIDGVIQTVHVKEGDTVARDQVVAEIGCADLSAQILALEAAAESARQARLRVLRGAREEERQYAAREVDAARATANEAIIRQRRMTKLAEDVVARADADTADRDANAAKASLAAAVEKQKLAEAGPLPEEIAKADADVRNAEQNLKSTMAQRDKCMVRSPLAGTVLRVHLKAGESFSALMPKPILTISDVSRFRVRAEIDERDLGLVRVGQKVAIRAEGFPDNPIPGEVAWLAATMGRKTVRAADPAEKSDRDIREALIDFDQQSRVLVVGLRVTVEFLKAQ